jgi:hypothetical protein
MIIHDYLCKNYEIYILHHLYKILHWLFKWNYFMNNFIYKLNVRDRICYSSGSYY